MNRARRADFSRHVLENEKAENEKAKHSE